MNNESQNISYIETWGRGIEKVCAAFESYGLKPPQFEFTCGGLKTIIYRNEKFAEEQDALLNVTVNNDDDSKDNETAQRTTQRIAQRNAQRTAQRILEAIGRNPQATVANLSAELGISERTTKTHIAQLKQDGLIERIDGKTYGYWIINDNSQTQNGSVNVPAKDDNDSKGNETAQRIAQRTSQRDAQRTAQRILEAIGRNPQATIADLSAELGISERTINTHIANLKQDGLIERINGKTYGYWKIIEP